MIHANMSDDEEFVGTNPITEKGILLDDWRKKVQHELNEMVDRKEHTLYMFKRNKAEYEKIIGNKVRKMRKLDKMIINRKKILAEIDAQIKNTEKAESIKTPA